MGNDDDENFLVRIYGQHNEKQKLLNRFKEQYRQYEMGTEERDDMRRGLISFQTFLLHVRYLYLKEAKKAPIIGDESHLLELFGELVALSPEVRGEIINLMKKYESSGISVGLSRCSRGPFGAQMLRIRSGDSEGVE